jgi:hypothetical protein
MVYILFTHCNIRNAVSKGPIYFSLWCLQIQCSDDASMCRIIRQFTVTPIRSDARVHKSRRKTNKTRKKNKKKTKYIWPIYFSLWCLQIHCSDDVSMCRIVSSIRCMSVYHVITEILLKVALSTIKQTNKQTFSDNLR